MRSNTIIGLVLVLVIVAVVIYQVAYKKQIAVREGYEDMFYAKDFAKGDWISRPTFKADLDPRFDSTRVGGGNIMGSFPGMGVQGAPLTPVGSVISQIESNPSYAAMGGPSGGTAYPDQRLPAGGLTSSQVNQIISEKFGRSAPAMTDPKMLLPVPDMKKALARDPSDPGTFMYDRYLFAPLKRRYPKVDVDRIRGDLAIPQLRMGWFDPNPVAAQDLTQGYFSNYLDIQQSTALKDSVFERQPNVMDEVSPFGKLAEHTVWSMV